MTDQRFQFVPEEKPQIGDALYVSFEKKESNQKFQAPKWILGLSDGTNYTKTEVTYSDYEALSEAIDQARYEFDLHDEFDLFSVHEVDRKGHSMYRELLERGFKSIPIDPASPDGKKNKPGKTDRLDAMKLVRLLVHFIGGDHSVFSPVNPPTEQIEDDREISRERNQLVQEKTAHINRIRALLFKHGIDRGPDQKLLDDLDQMKTSTGTELGTHLKIRIRHEYKRLKLVKEQLQEVEKRIHKTVKDRKEEPIMQKVINLYRIKSLGLNSCYELVIEAFGWRELANRKEVTGFWGYDDVPHLSGEGGYTKGISKQGHSRLSGLGVQLAWSWIRHQPESELAHWFQEQTEGEGSIRTKKLIIGLARKLMNRLRVYLEDGEVPRGARFKTNPRYTF